MLGPDSRSLTLPVVAIALLLVAASRHAGAGPRAVEPDASPARLTLTTERVVVFKDGYSLFVKRATGTTDSEGVVYMDEVPDAAVLGSFWTTPEGPNPILSTTAEWIEKSHESRRETDCVTTLELLRANEGRRVSLELADERFVKGKIQAVLELDREGPASGPAAMETIRELKPHAGSLVVLAAVDAGRVALPVASVKSISGDDLITRMERVDKVTRRTKQLSYNFGPKVAGRDVTLHLMYFTPGLRWIPTYRLSGELEADAELSLQGEILNEVEDVAGAALNLVVGVPNFRFKEVVSPLALEQTLRHTLREAAPNLMGQAMRNTFTQRSGEWRGDPASESSSDATVLADLVSSGSHDLFVYRVSDFSLRKGARATVDLWRDRVDLRHLYTLDIGLVRDGTSGATSARPAAGLPDLGDSSPLELAHHRVWHQLELKNDSNVPWTTGPALLLRNGLPLGQDLLTYTSVGAASLLPVTVAVDVRGDLAETETERSPNALRVNNSSYTLVRKRGEITITNYKQERIAGRVRLSLGGRVEEASDDGVISLNEFRADDWVTRQYAVNNHSDVEWTVDVGPGQSVTLEYVTSFYTR